MIAWWWIPLSWVILFGALSTGVVLWALVAKIREHRKFKNQLKTFQTLGDSDG